MCNECTKNCVMSVSWENTCLILGCGKYHCDKLLKIHEKENDFRHPAITRPPERLPMTVPIYRTSRYYLSMWYPNHLINWVTCNFRNLYLLVLNVVQLSLLIYPRVKTVFLSGELCRVMKDRQVKLTKSNIGVWEVT